MPKGQRMRWLCCFTEGKYSPRFPLQNFGRHAFHGRLDWYQPAGAKNVPRDMLYNELGRG